MISRELKLAASVIIASALLSFVSYKILQSGSYLAGVTALTLAMLAVVTSSLVFHLRATSKEILLDSVKLAENVSAAPLAQTSGATLVLAGEVPVLSTLAGGLFAICLLGPIVTGTGARNYYAGSTVSGPLDNRNQPTTSQTRSLSIVQSVSVSL